MKTSTYRVIMAAAFALLALRHLAQTTGDIATFKKASGPGDVKTYTTPVNSSLFSLNSSGNFSLLPQSTFQSALISGTNLRTVQGTSLLGSGNINIIDDAINDGVTVAGPSQNAVFDALAGKAATSHTHVSADITDASAGGNGVADAGKVALYGTEGQLRGTAVDANAAVYGSSSGNAYGGFFTGASSLWPAVYINGSGAQPALQVDKSGGGEGLDVSSTEKAARFHSLRIGGAGTPDIADFVTGLSETVKLTVKFDGGLEWGSTGAQTTATNLPAFGSSTKGVVPASGGGTTNFLRADGTWAAPSGGGGGVTSFNTRTGAVVPAPGDYTSADITNTSGVTGADVEKALDQLNTFKIEDGDVLTSGLQFPNGGLLVGDIGNGQTLNITPGENLTADRTLQISVGDADRTLTIGASASVSGTNTGDQDLSGLVVKANNLSDLANAATARTNLGLTALATTTPGTGVATALAVNVGTAGAFVENGGALGTPSSGNLANCTFPTLNQNTTGSAATLTTARTIQTNLASGSSASFNGSANITPGVTGTLPIGNGGTGAATREAAEEALTRTTESTPLGSDFTTSSTSAVDVTGLSLSVASNSTYRYEVWCEWASNNTSGTVTPNVTGPAGATVTGYRQATLAASTVTNGAIGISTAAAGTANSRQFMVMHGICNTAGTSGTLQVTLASSSGHTARIYAGATIRATKVQ